MSPAALIEDGRAPDSNVPALKIDYVPSEAAPELFPVSSKLAGTTVQQPEAVLETVEQQARKPHENGVKMSDEAHVPSVCETRLSSSTGSEPVPLSSSNMSLDTDANDASSSSTPYAAAAESDAHSSSSYPNSTSTYELSWSVASEQGYRNAFNATRRPIHDSLEDLHWPLDASLPADQVTCPLSGARVFILADGHGGAQAVKFFVEEASECIPALMDSKPWDFGSHTDRSVFTAELRHLFQIMDAKYASRKVEEYRRWSDCGNTSSIAGELRRPVDDGCTLVVNIVLGWWVCNINVGDSRTVIGVRRIRQESEQKEEREGRERGEDRGRKRSLPSDTTASSCGENGSVQRTTTTSTRSSLEEEEWTPIFASEDHNMLHPAKIWNIHRTGGLFVTPNGTPKTVRVDHPDIRNGRPYSELTGMRVYRPNGDKIKAVGVSHKRTLNLTATMGDLLFKIEPAVMSCVPDVSFVQIQPGQDCVVVAATDGVWDHLRWSDTETQNQTVLRVVGQCLAGGIETTTCKACRATIGQLDNNDSHHTDNPDQDALVPSISHPSTPTPDDDHTSLASSLALASATLVLREPRPDTPVPLDHTCGHDLEPRVLFTPKQLRYDDATAMVIYLRAVDEEGAGSG